MASNFKIGIHRKNGKLDLRLTGDFDGTSACELLNVLKEKIGETEMIVVDASGLKEVYPFGVDTFRNNLYRLKHQSFRLSFTGNKADTIAPEQNKFF